MLDKLHDSLEALARYFREYPNESAKLRWIAECAVETWDQNKNPPNPIVEELRAMLTRAKPPIH